VTSICALSYAGGIKKTPITGLVDKTEGINQTVENTAVVESDHINPEKAGSICEMETLRPVTIMEAGDIRVENEKAESFDIIKHNEFHINTGRGRSAGLGRAKARLIEIKEDGIVTAEEKEEIARIASDFGVEPLPVPLNIVSETEPNDVCTSADQIACGDTVWCATQTAGSDDHDWFVFTLDNGEPSWNVAIETHPTGGACNPASTDTYLELWELPCDSLIAYDDDGGYIYFSLITITLPPGTYAIHEDNSVWESDGSYHLSLICVPTPPSPANDLCGDAVTVSVPSSTAGTTISATVDSMDFCGTGNTAPGVWYKVTGTGNTITATTCNALTDYDTKLQVWCNSCAVPLCVTGNDDDDSCSYSTLRSTVSWCTEIGTEYLILVAGFDDRVGNFVLDISDDGDPCDDPVSCIPPEACPGDSIVINIQTDFFADETSWELVYSGTDIAVASGSDYSPNSSYTITFCSETDSCYDFHIYDSHGDGGASWQVHFNGALYCSSPFPDGFQDDCWAIGTGCAMPYGMCCYGDPYAPVCVDTFAVDCSALSGSIDFTRSCVTDFCAPCDTVTAIPANDDCQDVTPVLLTPDIPQVFTGNSCNSTIDCGLLNHPEVWVAFTTTIIGDVTVELCGSNYNDKSWGNTYLVLDDCPCVAHTFFNSVNFNCSDSNVIITWDDLPAGTWYFPVIWDPENEAGGDYIVTVAAHSPPAGRCCYDDGACADISSDSCGTLGGIWNGATDCLSTPCTQCPEDIVSLSIHTDPWPDEVIWELYDRVADSVVASGGPYATPDTLYTLDICVDEDGCYDFHIYDSFGDGAGAYSLYYNYSLAYARDGHYGFAESVFDIGGSGCGDAMGACCFVDQSCVDLTLSDCAAQGGSIWRIYEQCADVYCPDFPADCDDTLTVYSNGAQSPPVSQYNVAQCDVEFPVQFASADDFELPGADSVDFGTIVTWIRHWNYNKYGPGDYDGINVVIYENDAVSYPGENHPGGNPVDGDTLCAHIENIPDGIVYLATLAPEEYPYTPIGEGEYRVELPVNVRLAPGVKYWLEVQPIMELSLAGQSSIMNSDSQTGEYAVRYAPYIGDDPWTTQIDSVDLAFCLLGSSAGGTGCEYVVGDVNGSDSYNGLDITYGVNFFKDIGPDPQCEPDCPPCPDWFYCGDVNGSCNYNGLDITYGVNYFKDIGPAPVPCDACPSSEGIAAQAGRQGQSSANKPDPLLKKKSGSR